MYLALLICRRTWLPLGQLSPTRPTESHTWYLNIPVCLFVSVCLSVWIKRGIMDVDDQGRKRTKAGVRRWNRRRRKRKKYRWENEWELKPECVLAFVCLFVRLKGQVKKEEKDRYRQVMMQGLKRDIKRNRRQVGRRGKKSKLKERKTENQWVRKEEREEREKNEKKDKQTGIIGKSWRERETKREGTVKGRQREKRENENNRVHHHSTNKTVHKHTNKQMNERMHKQARRASYVTTMCKSSSRQCCQKKKIMYAKLMIPPLLPFNPSPLCFETLFPSSFFHLLSSLLPSPYSSWSQ